MSSIPDEIFNRIKSGASAQAWWDSLKDICEGRSRSLLIDLGQKLQKYLLGMTMYALTSQNSLIFANSSQLWVRASQIGSMLISSLHPYHPATVGGPGARLNGMFPSPDSTAQICSIYCVVRILHRMSIHVSAGVIHRA